MDLRHVFPAIAESASLAIGGIVSADYRARCVDIARVIRREAFDAKDDFPTLPMDEFIAELGGMDGDVLLPKPAVAFGNSIGGLIPYYYIGAIVKAMAPKACFEIGTYLGLSALTTALNSSDDSRIITIDLPDNFDVEDLVTLTKGDASLARNASFRVGIAFATHPAGKKIVQIRANSLSLNASSLLDQADFCFIDGGHSYELIKKDTENCLKILAPNGVILWDDYRWGLPGVARYLRELRKSLPLRRITGTQYVIYRK